jgi:hypothetical protein
MVPSQSVKSVAAWARLPVATAIAAFSILAMASPAGSTTPAGGSGGLILTAQQMENATLPAGVCASGTPASAPIRLSNGHGQVGALTSNYFSAWILGVPVRVNFGGRGHAGVAAAFECSPGGSDEWSAVFVFRGSPQHLKVLYGPIYPRSYNISQLGINGPQFTGVKAKGRTLTVGEQFQGPETCGNSFCMERTRTVWGLSSGSPRHLVVVQPNSKKTVVTVRATPRTVNGQNLIGGQAASSIAPGRTILVVCTMAQPGGGKTETDTGGWLPSADLRPVHLPDCDAGAIAVPSTSTTPALPPTTSTSTTVTVPPTTVTTPSPAGTSPSGPGSQAAATAAAAQWYANGTNACIENPPGNPPPVTPVTIPASQIPVSWSQFTPDQGGSGEAGDAATGGPGSFTASFQNGNWSFTPEFNFC